MSKEDSPSLFRKWIMRQYWRMQQSQAVVGLLLWGTTITLLVWPYVRWRFEGSCADAVCFNDTVVGIPATYFGPVSYTHLRAHETKANLVCRLLL